MPIVQNSPLFKMSLQQVVEAEYPTARVRLLPYHERAFHLLKFLPMFQLKAELGAVLGGGAAGAASQEEAARSARETGPGIRRDLENFGAPPAFLDRVQEILEETLQLGRAEAVQRGMALREEHPGVAAMATAIEAAIYGGNLGAAKVAAALIADARG